MSVGVVGGVGVCGLTCSHWPGLTKFGRLVYLLILSIFAKKKSFHPPPSPPHLPCHPHPPCIPHCPCHPPHSHHPPPCHPHHPTPIKILEPHF